MEVEVAGGAPGGAPAVVTPLSTAQRILFGGIGGIAPLVVLAISIEWATVFTQFTWIVFLGYSVKVILLFMVGGFVAFLQRTETDQFKCFVTGISAPALIATYTAGKAHADPISELSRVEQTIKLETIVSAFGEDSYAQFKRGFSGSDPRSVIAIIGTTNVKASAIRDAAAVELYLDCFIQGKLQNQPPLEDESTLRRRGLSSRTTVIFGGYSFFVMANLGSPSVALQYLNSLRGDIDISHIVETYGSKQVDDIRDAMSQPGISDLPLSTASRLIDKIRPDCQWNPNY